MIESIVQSLCELADASSDDQLADDLVTAADFLGVIKDRLEAIHETVIMVHQDTQNSKGRSH